MIAARQIFLSLAVVLATPHFSVLAQGAPRVHAYEVVNARTGHRSLLLPTIHVSAKGLVQPSEGILGGARALIVEHLFVPSDPAVLSKERAPWAATLTDSELDALRARARCADNSPQQVENALRRASVQMANMIAYTSCSVAGKISRDELLASSAEGRGMAILPLEDAYWVEKQRRRLPASFQAEGLKWILRREVDVVLSNVVTAFNRGNFDKVAELTRESFGSEAAAQLHYSLMVAERNLKWMEVLPAYLDAGSVVVAVGAMHFPGPDGLVQLLRARGYLVRSTTVPGSL
ncbi:MAG: TraB/GumN family protein [Sphingobacteriales bacterium]|nr:MAG: TraB/GumN family protein [Sphingobacteriales bacterium]